jgi:hypothetical protein
MTAVRHRFGLDSTSEVPVSGHHAVGSTVALRYLGHSTGKVVTRSEHERYKANGISLVLVFEDSGRPDQSDYAGGKSHAEFALKQATDILGHPSRPACIRAAADYDPAGHPSLTDAYYDGWAAVLPRADCGPYGNDEMVAHQHARGFRTLWQTYAWSGGRFFSSPDNSCYQYSNDHVVGGVGVDFNHVYGDDFGQWDYHPLPPVALDPHHYHRFAPAVRAIVVHYDQLRSHPHVHTRALAGLRTQLLADAKTVYKQAHANGSRPAQVAAGWNHNHAGWRFQQLVHRSQGKRLT